jgi:ssDNA-binding Zn-finger/Zn-ribbon topoisomerase 1
MSFDNGIPIHGEGDSCPGCSSGDHPKGGRLRLIKTRDGSKIFLGCTRYPACQYTVSPSFTSENLNLQARREVEDEERRNREEGVV